MRITTDHILDVWRIEPTLTYCGFEASPRPAMRKALLDHLGEVQLCADWLAAQEIALRITGRHYTSYFLKHAIEWANGDRIYVSNGAFLAAVVILGIPYRPLPSGSPNAVVAVQFKRRNRRLHGARGEYWSSYAEFRPLIEEAQREQV